MPARFTAERRHILREVIALTAHTADCNDRYIGICLGVGKNAVSILVFGKFGDREIRFAYAGRVRGCAVIGVEFQQCRICFNALLLQRVFQRQRRRIIYKTGACAAEHHLGAAPAEQVDLRRVCKRQCIVLILQQDAAFTFVLRIS